MRYFYEYKYKKGNRMVGGHNLEKIEFYDNYIKLSGVDIIPTNYDYEEQYWGTLLDMNEIEYLKIEPMLEKENDKNMKSARELFEELGYTYQESYFEERLDVINYSKSGIYTPQIIFNLEGKFVKVYRKGNKASWFDVKLLQAINQQINELGWK